MLRALKFAVILQTGLLSSWDVLLPFLRNYAAVPYLMTRQLHGATDVESVLPAGAESRARHPCDTPVTITPI